MSTFDQQSGSFRIGQALLASHGPIKVRKKPVVVEVMRFADVVNAQGEGGGLRACGERIRAWANGEADLYPESGTVRWRTRGGPPMHQLLRKEEWKTLKVQTLEGEMLLTEGNWLAKGVAGEFYPIKDEVFRETYDFVEEEEDTRTAEEIEAHLARVEVEGVAERHAAGNPTVTEPMTSIHDANEVVIDEAPLCGKENPIGDACTKPAGHEPPCGSSYSGSNFEKLVRMGGSTAERDDQSPQERTRAQLATNQKAQEPEHPSEPFPGEKERNPLEEMLPIAVIEARLLEGDSIRVERDPRAEPGTPPDLVPARVFLALNTGEVIPCHSASRIERTVEHTLVGDVEKRLGPEFTRWKCVIKSAGREAVQLVATLGDRVISCEPDGYMEDGRAISIKTEADLLRTGLTPEKAQAQMDVYSQLLQADEDRTQAKGQQLLDALAGRGDSKFGGEDVLDPDDEEVR